MYQSVAAKNHLRWSRSSLITPIQVLEEIPQETTNFLTWIFGVILNPALSRLTIRVSLLLYISKDFQLEYHLSRSDK